MGGAQYRMNLHFFIILQILFVFQFLPSSSLEQGTLVNVLVPKINIHENKQEVPEQKQRAMLIDMIKKLMRQKIIGRNTKELMGGQMQGKPDDRLPYWDYQNFAKDIFFGWRRPESRPKKGARDSRIRIF